MRNKKVRCMKKEPYDAFIVTVHFSLGVKLCNRTEPLMHFNKGFHRIFQRNKKTR